MSSAPPEPKLKETQWTVDLELAVSKELRARKFEPNWKTAPTFEKVFTIDTPPPYPSGRWHIGAVAGYSLIDIIARSRRMLGEHVLFPWGLDRNGINIELTVEKKFQKRMHSFPREEFLQLCQTEIEGIGNDLVNIAQRVGMSCDFDNAYATDAPEYRAMSQAIFIELWNKGHIVEDLRPNNYCPDCKTTIADAEVYYEERDTVLNHVKWDLEKPVDGVDHIIIATTRPELMAACQIVLVNPDDERYQKIQGAKVRIPTYDRLVEIRAHPTVDAAFGTGAMMICSYGDSTDVALFRELALQPISAISIEGTMTDATKHLAGIYVKKAKTAQIEKLKAEGRIVKEEQKKQKFPICERSKTPVELIQLKEWYVKQVDFVEDLRKMANSIEFHPEKHRQILLDWIDTVSIDWPISRRRYYHTEIPVWYCKSCRTPHVPKAGPYYQPWKQSAPAEISKCSKCAKTEFVGEEKVFDTWMDSSSSQMYVLHYLDQPKWFAKNYPASIRCNGRDIIRTWLYYSTLKSRLLLNQKPYLHAWITGLGMDEKGRKMSKSLGNVIDPDEILKSDGADAFRFWAASECTVGDDFRISKDRIGGSRKFLSKVYNVARFVSSFEETKRPAKLDAADEWILAELNKVIKEAREGFENFDFFRPANGLRDFVWNLFAPHYLEMAKRRAFNADAAAIWTLHTTLRAVLLILAPIAPFMPYRLCQELYGFDVHAARLPEPIPNVNDAMREKTPHVETFNSLVWKQKKEKGLSLNAPLSGVEVPAELAAFKATLASMHNLS